MTHPLDIRNLSRTFGDTVALHPLDLQIQSGEIFGLLGPNGAGKTTLISMITSLLEPSSGQASICGYNIAQDPTNAKMLVGLVPQEIVSHGFFTVNQVLNFHSGYYGLHRNQDRIDYLLDRLALRDHRNKLVRQLSGGMKRRLLIAKALVHAPRLLLLDEPTAGVDVDLRNDLWNFVRELHREQNITVLLTTHYLEEAEHLCHRIGVLHHGRLIALDQTETLIHQLTRRQVHISLSSCPGPDSLRLPEGCTLEDCCIQASIPYGETMGSLLKRLELPLDQVEDMRIVEGNLEDAFVSLIRAQTGGTNI